MGRIPFTYPTASWSNGSDRGAYCGILLRGPLNLLEAGPVDSVAPHHKGTLITVINTQMSYGVIKRHRPPRAVCCTT